MRHIDGVYTQRFNRFHKRGGPFFRGRNKALLIDADGYLEAVVRSIHLILWRLGKSLILWDILGVAIVII